jgi:UDP-GlcNAc3NAcA epimerase
MKLKKLVTIVGARPQFIKAAVISRLIRNEYSLIDEVMIHTGQHFDENMSDIFFEELEIGKPKYALNINNSPHGEMIGRMIIEIEQILLKEKPHCVIVYGDTNSTLAGAIAAKKLNIPLSHIEAGVRNYDEKMPEESNRYLVDRMAEMNFCCTDLGYSNLIEEGYNSAKLNKEVSVVGDLMYDAAKYVNKKDTNISKTCEYILKEYSEYVLVTIHRASNTDEKDVLEAIIADLNSININIKVVMLTHPRTRAKLKEFNINADFELFEPLGYFDVIQLIKRASMVITDSGGLTREAYFFETKSLCIMSDPVWPELVDIGVCINVVPSKGLIFDEFSKFSTIDVPWTIGLFGDGDAGKKILKKITDHINK